MDVVRLLVTGSRGWPNPWYVAHALDVAMAAVLAEDKDLCLVHGACPTGADKFADDWALEVGCAVQRWPAEWDRVGRSAGMLRNKIMVDTRPAVCLAFIYHESPGATHCANYAEQQGIPVVRARL